VRTITIFLTFIFYASFTCGLTTIDEFEVPHDYSAGNTDGTIWDGYIGLTTTDIADSSITNTGLLTLESTGSSWFSHPPAGNGPFLYRKVQGDFTAELEIDSWQQVDYHEVGILVRVPDLTDAGTGEDYVQIRYSPQYGIGNACRTVDNDIQTEFGSVFNAYANRFLQIQRLGNTFYFRTRPTENDSWILLPGAVRERADMDGLELQVGIWQGMQNTTAATTGRATFNKFILTESSSGAFIVPTDGMTAVSEDGEPAYDTYTVELRGDPPTADVTIALAADSQLELDKTEIVFTAQDWQAPQTVIVNAVDDSLIEGLHESVITHSVSSADDKYDGQILSLQVEIIDNDRLADFVRDGHIDISDAVAFAEHWLNTCQAVFWCDGTDLTGVTGITGSPGGVDLSDFQLFSLYWSQGPLLITEFMADNANTLVTHIDGYEEDPDWIEIYNAGPAAVNLLGWYLTDDADNLMKWPFPDIMLDAGEHFIIFASGRDTNDYVDDDGYYHTNFNLDANGDFLALVQPGGYDISHKYQPQYPQQFSDYSFGLNLANGKKGYFIEPTPGTQNADIYENFVADTAFSHDRGFYNTPFDLTITTETSDALILYTLDGSVPKSPPDDYTYVYTGPIHISGTTCVRAAAFKEDWLPTNIDTQTYIFVADVVNQSPLGESPDPDNPKWPEGYVNDQRIDYGMDPDIVNSSAYRNLIDDALLSIPSISFVTDLDNLFDAETGIYVNPCMKGEDWERPVSVELINPDGTEGFQVEAGLRMRGITSCRGSNPKHAFRLFFRAKYGDAKLRYPLFGNEGADEFDNVDLRCEANYSWNMDGPSASQHNTFIREVFCRDLQREMAKPYTRSRYYHLYINGQYWGLYQTQERAEASYAETYFSADKRDYDVVKTNTSWPRLIEVTDGTLDAYHRLWEAYIDGFASGETYYKIQGLNEDGTANQSYEKLLDVDNLIDYMLTIFYTGDFDAPITAWYGNSAPNNFYGIYNRITPDGFNFFRHDGEHTMLSLYENRIGPFTSSALDNFYMFNPQTLHQGLMAHEDYRIRFADRVYKHLFGQGIMTPVRATDLFMTRLYDVETAVIAESARWGDAQIHPPMTKADWQLEIDYLLNDYFPYRTDVVIDQIKAAGWYSSVDPPEIYIDGVLCTGDDTVEDDSSLLLVNPNAGSGGTIYYTLDGNDPRLPGGNINTQSALPFADGSIELLYVTEASPKKVLIPIGDIGTDWTGEVEPYDDEGWSDGTPIIPGKLGGVGYERNSGYEAYITYDVDSMYDENRTCYIRIPFTLNPDDLQEIIRLTLKVRFDDGFVAYINGTEIAHDNAPGRDGNTDPLIWDSGATFGHDDALAVDFVEYNCTDYLDTLDTGENVLAIHGLNYGTTSSDFLISVELIATKNFTNSPVILDNSVQVKTRVLDGSEWSALNEATFSVGPVAESIRITEIMYHPADPNTEFIELKNIGPDPINLNLISFTDGIDFAFGAEQLNSNDCIVVVENISEFQNKYGTGVRLAGQYTGALNNAGEHITLADAIGTIIHDFEYSDSWYEITDGEGFSLTIKDPYAADPNLWNEKLGWRPSSSINGSPGEDDAGSVYEPGTIVINEILAHSDFYPNDWIELHNTTLDTVNIGGWYLSDNNDDDPNYMKYRIADGTSIDPNGYIVFTQDENFGNINDPGCIISFALSENGETVYLRSATGDVLTGYYEDEGFGASEVGVALGRFVKSELDGGVNFVAMSENTPGAENAYPKVGPVIFNEIMYNPPTGGIYDHDEYEYIELYNISDTETVNLWEYDNEQHINVPWKFTDGIDYTFPLGTTIGPGQKIVVVKNPVAFSARYPTVPTSKIYGPYDGQLSNDGERLELSKPGDEVEGIRYYIRVDRVNYDDEYPWPTDADGLGQSLHQKTPTMEDNNYSNDVINWQADTPSPDL
jgi:hypothetical protein